MKLDEVRKEVRAILANLDHEVAHGDEDALMERFVRAVAAGELVGDDARAVAQTLATDLLSAERVRWSA